MNLNTLLPLIAVLGCPLCMILMMWMMNRGMGGKDKMDMGQSKPKRMPTDPAQRLAMLRQERETLEAEIAEASRVVELETQRSALLKAPALDKSDRAVTNQQGRDAELRA